MKILLYSEGLKYIAKSGVGRAIKHQMKALESNNIEYTIDIDDDYDIIHINTVGPKSFFLANKAKMDGKRVIFHAHSTEEDFRNSFILSNQIAPFLKKWLVKCYSMSDHIITPTPYSKHLLEQYGIENPITAISNGIEVKYFNKNEAEGINFRRNYGFKENDFVIMGVGLYIERKGILDFVELAKRFPQYKFIWFGFTPLYTIPKKIVDVIKEPPANLQFPGYVNSDVLKGAYSGANAFVFPTFEETEGIVVLEALAMKQNVIVRDIPVFDGWLEHNVNCLKAKNVDEFEQYIKLINSNECSKNLIENGYKTACDRDIKNVGQKLKMVYEELLGE